MNTTPSSPDPQRPEPSTDDPVTLPATPRPAGDGPVAAPARHSRERTAWWIAFGTLTFLVVAIAGLWD